MKRRPIVITLDRERLETLAGVKFSDNDFCELVELTTTVGERFQGPASPVFMLDDAWNERWHRQPRQIEMDARRAFVEAVERVWHECGGTGFGSYYNKEETKHTGRLNLLLQELLRAVGADKPGLAATLHHDIEFLRTGVDGREPLLYNNFRNRVWVPALRHLGLPLVTPHSARHSFISTLQAQGIEIGLVAKLAGHANANVTLGHYTQAVRGGNREVTAPSALCAGSFKIAVVASPDCTGVRSGTVQANFWL